MPATTQDVVTKYHEQVTNTREWLDAVGMVLFLLVTLPMTTSLLFTLFGNVTPATRLAQEIGSLFAVGALVVYMQLMMLRRQVLIVDSQLSYCNTDSFRELLDYLKRPRRRRRYVEYLDERLSDILNGGLDKPNSIQKMLDLSRFLTKCFYGLIVLEAVSYLVLPWLFKLAIMVLK